MSSLNRSVLAALIVLCAMPGTIYAEAVLEEIVVTAQKREQAYTDVPVAVSSFSGEILDAAQVTEFQDIIQVSPSVTYNQSGGMRGSGINIRGIGTTAFQVGVEPTVSVVVDGVTLGRTVQFLSDLDDIERVEVLRGPQGTLFGKNATAGLINVVTKRPTDEFEGSLRLTRTDDDMYGFTASVSGALSDTVRGRFAFFSRDYKGYSKNIFDGDEINGDRSLGGRGKLEFDLGERTNLFLIADYSKQDRNCCVTPRITAGSHLYEFDLRDIDLNDENTDVLVNGKVYADTETWGLSAQIVHDFENWELTSITAYRNFTHETQQDVDDHPYSTPAWGRLVLNRNGSEGNPQEQKQFSQELRLTSTGWDNFDLTVGLFYWDQKLERFFLRESNLCVAPAVDPSIDPDPAVTPCAFNLYELGWMDTTVNFENVAVFGQADWHFADRWTASLGLRYTRDEIDFDFVRNSPNSFSALVQPSYATSNDLDESDLSGKLSVQWDVTDNIMLYTSYAEGYKAPAFDIIFGLDDRRTASVPAEESEAWEVGMKAVLFDNRLRLGVTVFDTDFDNLQGQAFDPVNLLFLLTSTGTAHTEGIEVDFAWKPLENLLISGGVAWVDATFEDFALQQCYPGQTLAQGCITTPDGPRQDLSGEEIPNSPDLKYTLQARYDIRLDASFDMYITAGYRWKDEVYSEQNQDPTTIADDYGVLDLTIGLEADDGRWMARVFAKNVLDEFYSDRLVRQGAILGGGYNHWVQRDSERYAGIELEYRLGNL